MPETHSNDPRHAGPWIVLKFGGTSVSRRHRWDTIGRLAKQRADAGDAHTGTTRVLVVVWAVSGVTNALHAIADGRECWHFVILTHPEVLTYLQSKATDRDRWLAGMRRFQSALHPDGNLPGDVMAPRL